MSSAVRARGPSIFPSPGVTTISNGFESEVSSWVCISVSGRIDYRRPLLTRHATGRLERHCNCRISCRAAPRPWRCQRITPWLRSAAICLHSGGQLLISLLQTVCCRRVLPSEPIVLCHAHKAHSLARVIARWHATCERSARLRTSCRRSLFCSMRSATCRTNNACCERGTAWYLQRQTRDQAWLLRCDFMGLATCSLSSALRPSGSMP
jgi:hypothetical protein